MADIVGIDGKKLISGQAAPAANDKSKAQAHTYEITLKDGSVVSVYGVLFITPVFIALGDEETGEFNYITPFEAFLSILNTDMMVDVAEPNAA